MHDPIDFLRRRILASLAASGAIALLAGACGDVVSIDESKDGGAPDSGAPTGDAAQEPSADARAADAAPDVAAICGDQTAGRKCYAPNAIITKNSGYGGAEVDAASVPPPTRDANGCVVMAEVMNDCCNSAVDGPVFENGQCCYVFCNGACCGRWLRVARDVRLAPAISSPAWVASALASHSESRDLPTRVRDALREDFTRDAIMEHASIASFNTFALELMALGAPPELIRDALTASADEVEHARITFTIASRFGDGTIGPGALDLRGLAIRDDVAAIVFDTVRDGCIGEGVAALIASEQAARAVCPMIAQSLRAIAADEARHAELAWRFVAWAIATFGERARASASAAFDAGLPSFGDRPEPAPADLAAWHAHGRLSNAEKRAIACEAKDRLVEPLRHALLETSPRGPVTLNA